MRRPDDEFIDQFRKRFGDLLLTCHGKRRMEGDHVDAGDPILHASYGNENEPIDVMWTDEANTDRTLRLESGSPKSRNSHTPHSFFSMISPKMHETFHDRNVPGSGAVFHNTEGDLYSPMIRWNTKVSPFLDESIQCVPQISWNGPKCFTPLAESHRWLCDNTYFGQADDISKASMHHDSGYVTVNGANQDILADDLIVQPDTNVLATSETHVNGYRPYGDAEKFRYHVTLQAPTAMLWHAEKSPVTYLNKGQEYCLTVADSTPPTKKAGLFKYRTFVHVSFEGEDQRSNPVASWQLWKESRGLKEAQERKGKIIAVEYIDPYPEYFRTQGHRQIQLEESFVDGFCVTWTANSTANVYEAAISLKFNFLSTDFSRSKGVKGVPVRLCAKTKRLWSDDESKIMEDESELCYCVVKLFRDHGAERKSSNDKTHVKKKIEKLNKQITGTETGADLDGISRNNSLMNGGQFDIRPQKKRKWSISSRKSRPSDQELHAELATTSEILSSARSVSVLGLRGNVNDDPDLYHICLSHESSTSIKDGVLDHQCSVRATTLASEGAAQFPKKANLRLDIHSPDCQERLPKMPKVSIGTSDVGSPAPENHLSRSVACFYVQFTQSGKQPQGNHHAIYLADRTFHSLKAELAEKLQIDPGLISRILWVNSKGLKVLVDDNVVQHLPEAQIMIADVCEPSYTHVPRAPSRAKCSGVEIKLVF
ncbi:hypothetical protein N7475_003537 [Penicillium sp. IBT 31633x]|nr:hypothetical protein N7475_003537 [Penicillium sp. IBT 31633x]